MFHVFNNFKINFLKLLTFVAVSLLIAFGSRPIIDSPIIADDLFYFSKGLAELSDIHGISQIIGNLFENIKNGTSFNHIMPMAGLVAFFENYIAFLLLKINIDPLSTFTFYRSCWHLLSLVALSLFINETFFNDILNRFRKFIFTYAIAGIVFISVTQIHSLWKESPIAAYGLHGSGIAAMGFFYLFGLVRIAKTSDATWKQNISIIALGVFGILTYEMFFAALVVGFFLYVYLTNRQEGILKKAIWRRETFATVLIPTLVFSVSQILRFAQPEKITYDGTQLGDPNLIIPVFISSLYGSLPLAYLEQAVFQVGIVNINLKIVESFFFCTAGLYLIAWIINKRSSVDKKLCPFENKKLVLSVLISLWVISTFLFVISAKYQNELGVQIGRIYMFYTFGNLAIVGSITLWFYENIRRPNPLLALVLLLVGIYTNTYNAALVEKLNSNTSISTYTSMFSAITKNEIPTSERCELRTNLRASNLPEYYKNSLISSIDSIYFERYQYAFCPTFSKY
jgi:hypothetical protein